MSNWMLRGLVYAAAIIVVRLFQGALINAFQKHALLISVVLLLLFVVGVAFWGVLDGRADAAANPDPDRRADLAMTWLVAGLVAGLLGGAVTWVISLLYKGLYAGGLIQELTVFAAFTALAVFLPGMGGVTAGHWLVDRQLAKVPVRHHGLAATDEDRVDTDVFAAVGAAQGEETTEVTPAYVEETTETIKYSGETTEAAPTQIDAERTQPEPKPGEDQR